MKLKQKIALGLCTFYLLSVIGVALSMHFCGGKLASVNFYSSKAACKFCKNEQPDKKDDGCCKNTKVEVKIKDSHQSETAFKLPKLFSFEMVLPVYGYDHFKRILPLVFSRISNKTPLVSKRVALHVFNCVFRN